VNLKLLVSLFCIYTNQQVLASYHFKPSLPTKVTRYQWNYTKEDSIYGKIIPQKNNRYGTKNLSESAYLQYLDHQTILGYSFSANKKSVMNIHPEIEIGIGYKKHHFTIGISATMRFLKSQYTYQYYHLGDTFVTRNFTNLAFAFYFHKPIWHENNHEVFFEIAPGFEVLYMERKPQTYDNTRANAISFHANSGLGYRYTKKDLHYFQISSYVNYNNFSFGKVTNIAPQAYYTIRLAFGFLAKDDWATKKIVRKDW